MLLVKRLHPDAILPKRATPGSAGYDLSIVENMILPAHGKSKCKIGLAFSVPQGCYGRIAPRSGFSWKNHTDIGAGVVDGDYTDEVFVIIFNHSNNDIEVHKGDRIAQLILERHEIVDVQEVTDLNVTFRVGGFGSTGIVALT